MRTSIIILIAVASLLTLQVQAQGDNGKRVTGPKAKNVKAKDRLSHIEKTDTQKVEKVKGPEAKNQKPSERLNNVEKTTTTKKEVLKGPRAKNKKHFRK